MKHRFQIVLLSVLAMLCASCAKDIVDVTGGISGIVKDYTTGAVVENCQVSLSPSGNTVVTNAEGRYTFKSLQVGTYTLTFTKIGYKDQSTTVEVVANQTTTRDIQLEAMGAIDFSTRILDFGESNTNMSFYVKNNTASNCDINLVKNAEWLSFSQTRATISANNQLNITAYVDRSKVGDGEFKTTVTLEYTGATMGNAVMEVRMVKAKQGVPSIETRNAYDITASSFKIGGVISATGGSVVTSYGHCWSTSPNPTIDNQHTDYGRTTETMSFNSTINTNLVNTIVYVRAYATNQYGTSYGNEVQVTSTSTDPEDTGDFAGGTGTAVDPYLLRTPKHMQNMKNYPSAYFKMVADIDMDGINWIPFELSGGFDGDNHTLYNLKISPYITTNYQGLFSKLASSASMKNLTIDGFEVYAPTHSYIGAIAGSSECAISNCHVILRQANAIIGDQNVGGLAGETGKDVTNCSVSSNLSASVIAGNSYVGGAIGGLSNSLYYRNTPVTVSNIKVNCNISCGSYMGGIVADAGTEIVISQCSYNGTLTITSDGYCYGGIVGHAYCMGEHTSKIEACKTDVTISGTNGRNSAGGIAGTSRGFSIIACYSQGSIQGVQTFVGGISGDGGYSHCYTLMDLNCSGDGSFAIKDLASQYSNPINIAEFMRAANSQYASYWDYDRTWTWTGKINGKSVTAICPKLTWE